MLIKILLIICLLFMVANLFLALRAMTNKPANGKSMSTYIGRRLISSVVIVAIILIAMLLGYINPNPSPLH